MSDVNVLEEVPGFFIIVKPGPFGSGDRVVEIYKETLLGRVLLVRRRLKGSTHDEGMALHKP